MTSTEGSHVCSECAFPTSRGAPSLSRLDGDRSRWNRGHRGCGARIVRRRADVSLLHGSQRGRLAGNELLPPERQVEQVPELRTLFLLDQAGNRAAIDEVGLTAEAVKLLLHPIAERAEAPFVDGDAEALLLAVDD